MRKSLWLVLALLVIVGAPAAHADSFAVTFTCVVCSLPVPTAPDVTFPSPTLDVSWQGLEFPITLPSDWLPTDDYEWSVFFDSGTDMANLIFNNLTKAFAVASSNVSVPPSFSLDAGDLTFAPVSTAPEPVSLLLLGTGLLGVAGIKRRRRAY